MALSKKILLIEDDRDISSTLRGVLEAAGHNVVTAPNGLEGQKLIQAETPDLVITDMMMPRMGGFPVLDFLQTLEKRPKVIMITANEGGRHKAYAEMLGVDDYLRKPFAMDVLLESIQRIFSGDAETSDKDAEPAADEKPSSRMKRASKKRS